MAQEKNLLSFSVSSINMLNNISVQFGNSSSAHESQHYYFADNFYSSGAGQSMSSNNMYNSYMESQMYHQLQPPKLEDLLGGETETNDSSLTHIYSTNSGSEVDDSGFVGKNPVMGSEFVCQSIESGGELAVSATTACDYSSCPPMGTTSLSLGVCRNKNSPTDHCSNDKAIVLVSSESGKKVSDNFGQRTSIYRGVTRHRWTGRYEAHLWDNSCRKEGQARKGRQVYLGGYDKEDNAARSYDLAALKYWGTTAITNFPICSYTKEIDDMTNMTKQEFIASLRRKSSGFSRGASRYRGVTRHHQQGRWQARIGRVAGNKDLYLGTFATEEEAAEAYDIAAIKFRGTIAVTNFEMNRYDIESIMTCTLPIGGAAKKMKLSLETEQNPSLSTLQATQYSNNSSTNISFSALQPTSTIPRGVTFEATPLHYHNLFQHLHASNSGTLYDTSGATTSIITPLSPLPLQPEFFIWPPQS